MSLQFNISNYKKGEISYGDFKLETTDGTTMTMGVLNDYQSGFKDENKKIQFEKIKKLLKGKPSKTVIFGNRNGESEFNIDFTKDQFILYGGEFSPSFGGWITLSCSYSKNKGAIDKFMLFLMDEH